MNKIYLQKCCAVYENKSEQHEMFLLCGLKSWMAKLFTEFVSLIEDSKTNNFYKISIYQLRWSHIYSFLFKHCAAVC